MQNQIRVFRNKLLLLIVAGITVFGITVSTATAQSRRRCRTQIVNPQLSTSFFIPPHIKGKGDREFDGHGPDVYAAVTLVEVNPRIRLDATIYMRAKETKKDWTIAQGTRQETIYTAPSGWSINRVVGDSSSSYRYTDNDPTDDIYRLGSGELVREFQFVGDGHGHDAGIQTGVRAIFNPLQIELIETKNCVR